MYHSGDGVEQDFGKALEWTKNQRFGNIVCNELAPCMMVEVWKDFGKAAEWFTKAAEQGNASAE